MHECTYASERPTAMDRIDAGIMGDFVAKRMVLAIRDRQRYVQHGFWHTLSTYVFSDIYLLRLPNSNSVIIVSSSVFSFSGKTGLYNTKLC